MTAARQPDLTQIQQSVDTFLGEWTSRLPIEGVVSGDADLFRDPRIEKATAMCPNAKNALELGCLEGGHTYMLAMRGIEVTAIDGNARALERARLAGTLLGYDAEFVHADILDYVRRDTHRYDLVMAAGVLYHQVNPVALIDAIACRTECLFLWTRYFSIAALAANDVLRRHFDGREEVLKSGGFECVGYRHEYHAERTAHFLGASTAFTHWMRRQDIFRALHYFGFSNITLTHEDQQNMLGPAFGCMARKHP